MELLLKALDTAVWELGEAFTGMPDADLWTRPHPKLLSVGELAAHMAFGEAELFLGSNFSSPLMTETARYYTHQVDAPFSVPMSAAQVYDEVKRVHEACRAYYVENPHDSEELNPNRPGETWGWTLEYQAFHFAYHTGQIYSVRHMLGHETVDN